MDMFRSLSKRTSGSSRSDVVINKEGDDGGVVFTHSRGRTVSDMMSGMSINRTGNPAYTPYTDEQLTGHFARFKQYDLDDTGFITADNLKQIMTALDIPDITEKQCANMIDEVAILVGHENDGKLSFRDYCAIMNYEKAKNAANDAADATEEMHESMRESARAMSMREGSEKEGEGTAEEGAPEPAAAVAEEPPAEHGRMRGSSFAVMDTIALSRIQRFEQTIQEVAAKEKVVPAQVAKQTRFADKLEKFKKIENGEIPAGSNQESMQKMTLKAKLVAFEEAAKVDPVAVKTTWKNVRPGSWAAKKQIGSGPPPKKSLADLP